MTEHTLHIEADRLADAITKLAVALTNTPRAVQPPSGASSYPPAQNVSQFRGPAPGPGGSTPPQPPVQHASTAPAYGAPPAQQAPPPAQQTPPPVQQAQQAPVAAAPQYSLDQLQLAAGTLMDKVPQVISQLQGLLQKFGVSRVSELKPEQMGPYAMELRGLGAKI